jgi:hypothetical protein
MVNSWARATASRLFQAAKNALMALRISARVQVLAAGVPGAALLAPADALPVRVGRLELPVQLTTDRSRAGSTTSPASTARPRRQVTMLQVCARGRYLPLPWPRSGQRLPDQHRSRPGHLRISQVRLR